MSSVLVLTIVPTTAPDAGTTAGPNLKAGATRGAIGEVPANMPWAGSR